MKIAGLGYLGRGYLLYPLPYAIEAQASTLLAISQHNAIKLVKLHHQYSKVNFVLG